MGDFSDRSTHARQVRIPINVLLRYIKEARAIDKEQPPKRFRPLTADQGVILDEGSSLSTTRVRQRLCDLMGTDVIRLNDKRYFQKLSDRLQEEYETVMDKQEEQRSASEKQRMRRLMLEGIIEAPNDYRSVIHGEHKHNQKKKKKRKIHRKHDGDHGDSTDDRRFPHTHSPNHSDDDTKKEVVTQVEVLSRPNSTSRPGSRASDVNQSRTSGAKKKHVTLAKKESKSDSNERQIHRDNEMHVRPPHHDQLRSSSSCSTHRKSRRVKSASARLGRKEAEPESDESDTADNNKYETQSLPATSQRYSKFSKHEPERVQELRNTETVAGLYSIAEELISTAKTEDNPERKVTFKKK